MRKYLPLFRWMTSVSVGYRGSIVLCTVLSMSKIILGWCFVWVSKWAVDIATHEVDGNLYHALLCIPCIMVLEIAFGAWGVWVAEMRNVKLDNRLKQTVFKHLIDSEWRGIEKYHTGDVVNRIEGDVSSVVGFATGTLPDIFILLFQLIGSFVMLMMLDQTLAWIVLLVSPVFIVFARLYMRKLHKITRSMRDSESEVQSQIQENLQFKAVIKTLEQTNATLERLKQSMDVLTNKVRSRTKLSIWTNILLSSGFSLSYFLTFGWGVVQIYEGIIGYGTMVAFLQLSARVQRPIGDLSRQIPVFVHCFTSAERLQELLQLPAEENEPLPDLCPDSLAIDFEDVSFTYVGNDQKSRQIFDHFSCHFEPNSSVAILGETGVGKTTLIRMLLSLVKPETGSVTLSDGVCKQYLTAYSRRYFSYVPQGNTLLSGTIRSNLQMGSKDATDEEMWHALEMAAADFVHELPLKLDNPCGEYGGGLSEGQAQRIAIARALLRRAPILLLDEATSALDPETEMRVMDNLVSDSVHRMVVLVTHRTAAAQKCNTVLRL
ncbi:MAG: ABC transporter ATP-binding protein [Bacteroidales bacterium]|nr:ABC transporter ATP-binding protein [Bacteroidales bacterium]